MTPANALTLMRLPLALGFWVLRPKRTLAAGILIAAGITDVLDGWLARKSGRPNPAGAWLDPLCDKIFVISALTAISRAERVPVRYAVLVGIRDLIQIPLVTAYLARSRQLGRPVSWQANWQAARIGKLATTAQFAALFAMLLRTRALAPLALSAGAIGPMAALYYAQRTIHDGPFHVTSKSA